MMKAMRKFICRVDDDCGEGVVDDDVGDDCDDGGVYLRMRQTLCTNLVYKPCVPCL